MISIEKFADKLIPYCHSINSIISLFEDNDSAFAEMIASHELDVATIHIKDLEQSHDPKGQLLLIAGRLTGAYSGFSKAAKDSISKTITKYLGYYVGKPYLNKIRLGYEDHRLWAWDRAFQTATLCSLVYISIGDLGLSRQWATRARTCLDGYSKKYLEEIPDTIPPHEMWSSRMPSWRSVSEETEEKFKMMVREDLQARIGNAEKLLDLLEKF